MGSNYNAAAADRGFVSGKVCRRARTSGRGENLGGQKIAPWQK
jgi:hypothetical protein